MKNFFTYYILYYIRLLFSGFVFLVYLFLNLIFICLYCFFWLIYYRVFFYLKIKLLKNHRYYFFLISHVFFYIFYTCICICITKFTLKYIFLPILLKIRQMKILCTVIYRVLSFFCYKINVWYLSVSKNGNFFFNGNFPIWVSLLIYIYLYYLLISFFFIFLFFVIQVYIYTYMLCFILIVCAIFYSFYYYFIFLIRFGLKFVWIGEIFNDVIFIINFFSEFLNRYIKILLKKSIFYKKRYGLKQNSINTITILLLMININNVNFISLYNKYILNWLSYNKYNEQHCSEKLPGLVSNDIGDNVGFQNTAFFTQGLINSFLNKEFTKHSIPNSVNNVLLLNLFSNFVKKDITTFVVRLRNLFLQTKKYKINKLELKKNWTYNQKTKKARRTYDLLQSGDWLFKTEEGFIEQNFTEEERYSFFSVYGRPLLLFFSFFKSNIISLSKWVSFYVIASSQKMLDRKTSNIISTYNNNDFLLEKPYKKPASSKWDRKKNSFFGDITLNILLFFNTLGQLNYSLFLVLYEVFGLLFEKGFVYAASFYKIKEQLEQDVFLSWKIKWCLKIVYFLLYEVWQKLFYLLYVFYLFYQQKVFKNSFFLFIIVNSINLFIFFLQFLKLGDRSVFSLFLLGRFEQFFKFKFTAFSTVKFKNFFFLGYFGIFFEKLLFIFFFFVFLCIDLFYALCLFVKKKKWGFIFCGFSGYFYENIIFNNFVSIFLNPIFEFSVFYKKYKENFIINKNRKELKHYTLWGLERVLLDLVIYLRLIQKYWWSVKIANQSGIKTIPFFYKYSLKFLWFNNFLKFFQGWLDFIVSYFLYIYISFISIKPLKLNYILLRIWKFLLSFFSLLFSFLYKNENIFIKKQEFIKSQSIFLLKFIKNVKKYTKNNTDVTFPKIIPYQQTAQNLLKRLYNNNKNVSDTRKIKRWFLSCSFLRTNMQIQRFLNFTDINNNIEYKRIFEYLLMKKKSSLGFNPLFDSYLRYYTLKRTSKKFQKLLSATCCKSLDSWYFHNFTVFFEHKLNFFRTIDTFLFKQFIYNNKIETIVSFMIEFLQENISFFQKSRSLKTTYENWANFFTVWQVNTGDIKDMVVYDNKTNDFIKNSFFFSDSCICFFKKTDTTIWNSSFKKLWWRVQNAIYYEYIFLNYFCDYIYILWSYEEKYIYNNNNNFLINISNLKKKTNSKDFWFLNRFLTSFKYLNINSFPQSIYIYIHIYLLKYYLYVYYKHYDISNRSDYNVYMNNMLIIFSNIAVDYLFGAAYNVENCNSKWNCQEVSIDNLVENNFKADLFVVFKRHKLYLENHLNKDLKRILTVLNLRWSLLTDEELMWGEYVQKKKIKKFKNPFLFPGNVMQRTKALWKHNSIWFSIKSGLNLNSFFFLDVNKNKTEDFVITLNKNKEKLIYLNWKLFLSLDLLVLMYQWYLIKLDWNYTIFKWKFFFTTRRFYFLFMFFFLFFFFCVFSIYQIFYMNFLYLLVSYFISIIWFVISVILNLFYHLFSLGDFFTFDFFREYYEFFFYNYILTMPFYEMLVFWDLQDLFLYCINNLALYEEPNFNVIRFIWIIYITIFICFINFCFDFCFHLNLTNIFIIEMLFFIFGNNVHINLLFFIFESFSDSSFLLNSFSFFEVIVIQKLFLNSFWFFIYLVDYGWSFLWDVFMKSFFYLSDEWLVFLIRENIYNAYIYIWKWLIVFLSFKYSYLCDLFFYNCFFIDNFCKIFQQKIFLIYFYDNLFIYIWLEEICLYYVFSISLFLKLLYNYIGWSIIYISVCFVDFFLDLLISIWDFGHILKNLFFKKFDCWEFFILFLQIWSWVYVNLIYYLILIPFMYVWFFIIFLIKMLVYIPVLFFNYFFDFILIILWCFNSIWCFISHLILLCIQFGLLFYSFFLEQPYVFIIKKMSICFYNYLSVIQISLFNGTVLTKILLGFQNVISLFFIPLSMFFFFFLKILSFFFYPLISVYLFFIKYFFFFKYWVDFILIFKEIFFLIVLIWKYIFLHLFVFFKGGLDIILLLGRALEEAFPFLKNILDPIGGLSIFYATLYYYLFISLSFIWNYSFRLFNDTFRDPPVPDQAWIRNARTFEEHPIIQRLPFDVYRLLYSERLVSDYIEIPKELKNSLDSWKLIEDTVYFSRIRIQETPLQIQGYYYLLLNKMAKKLISFYYLKRYKYIIGFYKIFLPKHGFVNSLGFLKTTHALWDTYAYYYLTLVTEEDWEYMETAVEVDHPSTKFERLADLSLVFTRFELLFPEEKRRQRALRAQEEFQKMSDRFGQGEADEMVWGLPILSKWFGRKRISDLQNDYKLIVFRLHYRRGFDPLMTSNEKEAKKKFLQHWFYTQKQDYKYIQTSPARGVSLYKAYNEDNALYYFNKQRIISYENNIKLDPDDYIIRKYKKIKDFETVDTDLSLDPFFFGVRTLDLFLYPVLVLATVNTGWWYSFNGFSDAVGRYVSILDYADELVSSSLEEFERIKDVQKKTQTALFDVSSIEIYEPNSFFSKYLPSNHEIWDLFQKNYPEVESFFEKDPAGFLSNFYKHVKITENGELWLNQDHLTDIKSLISVDEDLLFEEFDNNFIIEEMSQRLKENAFTDDNRFWHLISTVYDQVPLVDFFYSQDEEGMERAPTTGSQLFNKWKEPKEGPSRFTLVHEEKGFFNDLNLKSFFINLVKSKSVDVNENEMADLSVWFDSDNLETSLRAIGKDSIDNSNFEEENIRSAFIEKSHPLDSEYAQRDLILRYHNFPQTNISPYYWAQLSSQIKDFFFFNFLFVDNTISSKNFPLFFYSKLNDDNIYIRDMDLNYSDLSEYMVFLSKQISTMHRYNIPILRQSAFPWNDTLWMSAQEVGSGFYYKNASKSINFWYNYWNHYIRNHPLLEVSSISEDFDEEVLYGNILYQHQASGFFSFFNTMTLQRFIWLFFKIYEDTFFGKFLYSFLRQGVMRRHTIGIETSPFVLQEIDKTNGFVQGIDPFFVVSDIKDLKIDFFNMYTNYTVYSHFNTKFLQRLSLSFFFKPEEFEDSWFKNMTMHNYHIAIDSIKDHVRFSSYEYPLMYYRYVFIDQFLVESNFWMKQIKDFFNIVWLFNTEFFKIILQLSRYLLSFELVKAAYDVVAVPLLSMYDFTKNILVFMQFIFVKIQSFCKLITMDLHIWVRLRWLGTFLLFNPIMKILNFSFVACGNIIQGFFFMNKWIVNILGLDLWWESTIIRWFFIFWPKTMRNFYNLFNDNCISDVFFWIFKWPLLLNQYSNFAFVFILEQWWNSCGNDLGIFLTFSLESKLFMFNFIYLSDWFRDLKIFWSIMPFCAPFLWFNLLYNISNRYIIEEDYIMFKFFKNLDFFKETDNWINSNLDFLVFSDSVSILTNDLIDKNSIYNKNYKEIITKEEFNTIISNEYFLKAEKLKPVFSRENYEAPFSFFSNKGFLVFSRQEIEYISSIYSNKDYNYNLYNAVDFLHNYGKGLSKVQEGDLFLWLTTKSNNVRISNVYGFIELPLTNYQLNFAFLKEIGPNFYLNLREYEEKFDLPMFRYFFHRYQYFITHAISYNKFKSVLSDTGLEMKYLYTSKNFVNISFDDVSVKKELYKPNSSLIKISMDIYGNIIYIYNYKK